MTTLTKRQEGFTLDIFKGLSETDAYKNNYTSENMSIEAVYVEACRLKQHPKVALRLTELRLPAASAAIASVNERKERLSQFIREDLKTDRGKLTRTNNIQASAELSKMDGAYAPIKHQISKVVFKVEFTKHIEGEKDAIQRQGDSQGEGHGEEEEESVTP